MNILEADGERLLRAVRSFGADQMQIVTKAIQTNAPVLAERLCEEQKRLVGLVARRRAVRG